MLSRPNSPGWGNWCREKKMNCHVTVCSAERRKTPEGSREVRSAPLLPAKRRAGSAGRIHRAETDRKLQRRLIAVTQRLLSRRRRRTPGVSAQPPAPGLAAGGVLTHTASSPLPSGHCSGVYRGSASFTAPLSGNCSCDAANPQRKAKLRTHRELH